jgi:hypothetical protein
MINFRVFLLIYVSSAVRPLSQLELLDILEVSRTKNEEAEITGLLLYKDGNFMQFLEGPRENVCSLMEKIKKDPRHRGVITLLQQEQRGREFSNWSMGFKEIESDILPDVPGYSDLLDLPLTSEQFLLDPSKSLNLLLGFKHCAL